MPALAREMFAELGEDYAELKMRLSRIEARLPAWQRQNEMSRRLMEVPSIGPIGAALLAMKVPDPNAFRSGRDFAAWLGLTPKDHSTAGKQRLGVITRAGDEALRRVLVVGATAVIQQVIKGRGRCLALADGALARKPPKLAAVALANKTARIVWKLMVSGERYDPDRAPAARAERSAALTGASRRAALPPPSRWRSAAQCETIISSPAGGNALPASPEACSRRSRWCDRSIPRRETLRGTQWHQKSPHCLDLVSRKPSWQRSCATATTDRTYDRKRSDPRTCRTLASKGPSTYGSRLSPG